MEDVYGAIQAETALVIHVSAWSGQQKISLKTLSEFFYLPTDAQKNCFKRNIKIYIKTAPTCFGLTLNLLAPTTVGARINP